MSTAAETQAAAPDVDDATRSAITVTAYDLEVHLRPAQQQLSVLARLTLRNTGQLPLSRVTLQISSSLKWEEISARAHAGSTPVKLPFDQHRIETDTDHTGAVTEAVLRLPAPLPPGAELTVTGFYSGTIARAAVPPERSGAPPSEAALLDWDQIDRRLTALRGFGQVLWYPVSSPQIFLGDGAKMAQATGRQMRAGEGAMARLRLLVETAGDDPTPATALFCGREASLTTVNESAARGGEGDAGATERVSTALFPSERLGFGTPSLFVSPDEPRAGARTVAVLGASAKAAQAVEQAADAARPLIESWFGEVPARRAFLLEHDGEPFAQRASLVEPASSAAESFAMTRLETHAWFVARGAWLDEGVAQLLPLLAIERDAGRSVAEARIQELQPALSLAEAGGDGEALIAASRPVTYRNKAVAVLWMLRGLVGDDALKAALQEVRAMPSAGAQNAVSAEALEFEHALEKASGKDLAWFFEDWVIKDKGLPDLSIVSAQPRAIIGRDAKLVAIQVRNDGDAGAEVPVTVRSGELTATEPLFIPGKSAAAVRIVFQGTPDEVQVNDGSVPEVGHSVHILNLR